MHVHTRGGLCPGLCEPQGNLGGVCTPFRFSVPPRPLSEPLALSQPALADSTGPTWAGVRGLDGAEGRFAPCSSGTCGESRPGDLEGPYPSIRVLGQRHRDEVVTPAGSRCSDTPRAGLVPAPPALSFGPRLPTPPGFFPRCWGDSLSSPSLGSVSPSPAGSSGPVPGHCLPSSVPSPLSPPAGQTRCAESPLACSRMCPCVQRLVPPRPVTLRGARFLAFGALLLRVRQRLPTPCWTWAVG